METISARFDRLSTFKKNYILLLSILFFISHPQNLLFAKTEIVQINGKPVVQHNGKKILFNGIQYWARVNPFFS